MYRNILLPQLKRAPWRTGLFFVLLAIATAFFCLSANLYVNSARNISQADDAFSTIAVIEFYENLNKNGQSVAVGEDEFIGSFSAFKDDVDLARLSELPGVKSVDLRQLFCAHIPGFVSYHEWESTDGKNNNVFSYDLIRFTIHGDVPVVLKNTGDSFYIDRIIDHANPMIYYENYQKIYFSALEYPFQKEQIVLYPEIEYVAPVSTAVKKAYLSGKEVWRVDTVGLYYDLMSAERKYEYYRSPNGSASVYDFYELAEGQPFDIWQVEKIKTDSVLRQYLQQVAEAYRYSSQSFAVMTTDRLEGLLPFHQGQCYISQGRGFTQKDHLDGNAVCIVSSELAKQYNWSIGDKLDMYFYDGVARKLRGSADWVLYKNDTQGFFDQREYTIIGLWEETAGMQLPNLDEETTSIRYDTILVPTSSVQNLDTVEAPASGSRLTVHLENGMMEEFLEAASKVTLSESADEVKITAFDQGYSQAQDSLQSMLGTAQFLLVLSSVLLVVAGVLLAFFYTQSQKQNMALMRLLGCSRRQAGTMSLLGSLLILLPGGLLGMGAGHLLTNRVASAILNGTSSLDKPEYAGFREVFGVQAEVDFALSAQSAVSAAALAIAVGLFLTGCIIFTLLLLRKEPREALQDK